MLNLIEEAWIPVRCQDGSRRIIAPWQMALPDVVAPDWQRPDMNIACYELLVGLVYMAMPPADEDDWREWADADPDRLQAALAPYAPAFNLLGDGPLFMQDLEPLSGTPNPVDMLFIDSAGGQTMRNNIDVMVHRRRYDRLSLPDAAMALYMLQDFAPSGGAGNRTSMRGGGPLVTMLDPGRTLWDFVWLNTPFGKGPFPMEKLPWMRPTFTSEKGQKIEPVNEKGKKVDFDARAFFGMPRRLRLVGGQDGVTGVIQKPYGANYAAWKHPLSPYYRQKEETLWLPRHPRAGRFGYRNWLGITVREGKDTELSERALILQDLTHGSRGRDEDVEQLSVVVAGWAMNNMSPRDFILSRQPFLKLDDEATERLHNLVKAAEQAASLLNTALSPVLDKGEGREAEREEFFLQTEVAFHQCCDALGKGENPAETWLKALRKQALGQFNALARPGLAEHDMKTIKAIVEAGKLLNLSLHGYTPKGQALFRMLGLQVPAKGKRKAA